MKKIKKVLFLILLILAILVLITKNKVQAATSGHYTYEENSDGTITITKYDGTAAKNLEIPSTIDGKSVTSIGYSAFYGCSKLTGNLIIPNSVISLNTYAFARCSGLTGNLTIPNSVTSIGYGAFYECSGLTGVLTIPNSVTSIGDRVFYGCSKLESINVLSENTKYSSQDGILFNKNKTELIQFPNGKKKNNYSIPNSVTSIGDWAFYKCSGLTGNLTIPNSVTSIGDWAFYKCSGLTGNLTIPNSVIKIGCGAFSGCSSLTGNLIIPNGLTIIESEAFRDCSGLTGNLTIPNSVTSIGSTAFYGCSSFKGNLTIGNSVTSIGGYAFSGCSGLTGNLTIPNSVISIGDFAFDECRCLNGNLVIPNDVTNIGGCAFHECSGFNGNLTIGNSVTRIGSSAFSGCSGLTGNITIPNSVTSIGNRAFSGCSALTGKITIPNSAISIEGYAFDNCKNLQYIILCGKAPEINGYTFYSYNKKIYYLMNKTGYDGEYWPKSQMEAVPFPDVIDKNEWYYAGAKYTLEKGIITGHNDGYGTFRPFEKVTRAMVVTMLYRMEGSPNVTLTNAFPDVPKNEWYAKAVQWAKNNKIVNGYSTGKFGPNDNIKRQDLAIMLLNYAKYKGKYNTSKLNNLDQYKDKNKVDKYAIDGMKWAVGNEIIHGKDSVTLDPTNNATRGETAIMIMNYCKNIFGWK